MSDWQITLLIFGVIGYIGFSAWMSHQIDRIDLPRLIGQEKQEERMGSLGFAGWAIGWPLFVFIIWCAVTSRLLFGYPRRED